MLKRKTTSPEELKKIANLFAKEIAQTIFNKKTALVLALSGDLGAGKTTFAQGFLRGLGVRGKITSPTFILMQRFSIPSRINDKRLKINDFRDAYHIDCYRIKNLNELKILNLKKIFSEPNIVIIEWAEKIKKLLPKKNIFWMKLFHGKNQNERFIKISAQ